MRKTVKSALSVVLSAAIALTMGGIGTLANNTSASAEDAKPSFTMKLAQNGNLWGWGADPTGDAVSVAVTDFGTYTLSADAPADAADLSTAGGAFWADTGLSAVPTDYDIVAKTVKVNDTEYDWSKAPAYLDGDSVRLSIANEWGDEKANPLKSQTVAVKKGDKLTFTFEVKAKSADAPAETAAPADPTAAPTETAAPAGAPAAADLKGTAQLDSQANGWCGNEDCTNVKATINGAGTYTVSSTWEEVQEDPQAYCAVTIADLKDVADYITFSNVTVWVDGKVVDIPVIYGGDKDCRIQLWNTWGIPDDGDSPAGSEVPANFPESFYELKVQFTIGVRETARDWDAEDHDSSLITMDTTQPNYEPEKKPADIVIPTPSPEPTPSPAPSVKKNVVKSLSAKKSVSVKKGKKANVTVTVKAADNKKKTTDKVTVTSSNKKVAKVVKTSVKAGKIVVSVKGVKKGTAKITVKAAKKKATVTVKVK